MWIAALPLIALQDPRVVDGVIVRPEWVETPTAEQMVAISDMSGHARTGRVELLCVALSDGRMDDCRITALATRYPDLGVKAFEVADHFRIRPRLSDGTATAGLKVRIVLRWEIPAD